LCEYLEDDKLTWIDDTIGKHSNIKQAMKPIMDDNFMPFKDSEDKAFVKDLFRKILNEAELAKEFVDKHQTGIVIGLLR
jgi:hypothetical protein